MATFKTRARALDMLGRQQIAGIPTAISELSKTLTTPMPTGSIVDYYRSDGLFVLRDDGIGMTKEDFEQRWLTLGTESKLSSGSGLAPPPTLRSKPKRSILGEKGIGRLAIAVIGPQLLVLTRPMREDVLGDLTAAFIHWGFFQVPGINLDPNRYSDQDFQRGHASNPASDRRNDSLRAANVAVLSARALTRMWQRVLVTSSRPSRSIPQNWISNSKVIRSFEMDTARTFTFSQLIQ